MKVLSFPSITGKQVSPEICDTITSMFERAQKHTHLDGRFSPHRNFVEELEQWCEETGRDFRAWNLSMFRLFSLKSKHPDEPAKNIVDYVLKRDADVLKIDYCKYQI